MAGFSPTECGRSGVHGFQAQPLPASCGTLHFLGASWELSLQDGSVTLSPGPEWDSTPLPPLPAALHVSKTETPFALSPRDLGLICHSRSGKARARQRKGLVGSARAPGRNQSLHKSQWVGDSGVGIPGPGPASTVYRKDVLGPVACPLWASVFLCNMGISLSTHLRRLFQRMLLETHPAPPSQAGLLSASSCTLLCPPSATSSPGDSFEVIPLLPTRGRGESI